MTKPAFELQDFAVALMYVSSMAGFQHRKYLPRIAATQNFHFTDYSVIATSYPPRIVGCCTNSQLQFRKINNWRKIDHGKTREYPKMGQKVDWKDWSY